MASNIVNFLFAAILILSMVIFFDLLIKLRNAILIKSMLLIVVVGIAWNAFATIYTAYSGYNRWMVDLPYVLIYIGCLNFFSFIYSHNIKYKVLLFTSFLLVTQLFFLLYFSFIYPVNESIPLKDILVFVIERKIIKVMYAAISLVIILQLSFKIVKKYSHENLYYQQIRSWSIGIGIVFSLCMVIHIFKTINATFEFPLIFVKGFFHLSALLLILYRPNFINYASLQVTLSDVFTLKKVDEFKNLDFVKIFFHELYFLKAETDINYLANKLNTTQELLVAYIKDNYQMTFSELVNKNRVDYFVSLVSARKHTNLTTEALAQKCGFTTRHNLYKSFKKFHGGTPSDLLRSVA